jgi:predicted transposase YdaD
MKESSTYQIILDEGRVEGRVEGRAEGRLEHAHSAVLRLGKKHLGQASPEITVAVTGISDLDRLDRILERVLEAACWNDLLQTP